MLQHVGTKLACKLTVLVVDLDLMSRRTLSDDDVTGSFHDRDTIWVQQLAISLAAFAKLELEAPLLVEDLDAMVVGIGNDDVVLSINSHTRRLSKLAFHHTEFSKLAVINHLLALDLRAWRIERSVGHQLRQLEERRIVVHG